MTGSFPTGTEPAQRPERPSAWCAVLCIRTDHVCNMFVWVRMHCDWLFSHRDSSSPATWVTTCSPSRGSWYRAWLAAPSCQASDAAKLRSTSVQSVRRCSRNRHSWPDTSGFTQVCSDVDVCAGMEGEGCWCVLEGQGVPETVTAGQTPQDSHRYVMMWVFLQGWRGRVVDVCERDKVF